MSQQKVTEETRQIVIQKLSNKYQAILTMIGELQDNLNQIIAVDAMLLKEKDAKIAELQAPILEKQYPKTLKPKP